MDNWRYNLLIEGSYGSILVNLGSEKGWIEKYNAELASARRLMLAPKEGYETLMPVSVEFDGNKRWIFFSKVFGRAAGPGAGTRIRVYCIGWQVNVNGTNVKSLMWVYPNGAIENGPEPSFVRHYFGQ